MKSSLKGKFKILKLMAKYFVLIKVEPDPTLSVEEFKVISAKTGKEFTETSVAPTPIPKENQNKKEEF